MKWAIFSLSVLIGSLLVVELSFQQVRITNLEKEVLKLQQADIKNNSEIKKVEEQNKRYLDSCLDILVKGWQYEEQ